MRVKLKIFLLTFIIFIIILLVPFVYAIDTNNSVKVSTLDLISFIDLWINGKASTNDLVAKIDLWISGMNQEPTSGNQKCISNCTGKICEDDGCGGSCGECLSGETCSLNGKLCLSLVNVNLIHQSLYSQSLVNVNFNVTVNKYPSQETTGPPASYRDFYEVFTNTYEDGVYAGSNIVTRFYKNETYPLTKIFVFGYVNGILYGTPLIKPNKHYKFDFYLEEYPWGSYNYTKIFIKTLEFDSLKN